MQRCADALFRSRRVTTDQYSLLWIVGKHDGIRQNELAAELYTDPNTVTAMLSRLEQRGLVAREVCGADGRARRVRLTAAGKRLLDRLSADWDPMRIKLREIFAGESGEAALRILEEVRVVMTDMRRQILEQQATPGKRSRTTAVAGASALRRR